MVLVLTNPLLACDCCNHRRLRLPVVDGVGVCLQVDSPPVYYPSGRFAQLAVAALRPSLQEGGSPQRLPTK